MTVPLNYRCLIDSISEIYYLFQLSDSGDASDELLSKTINQYFRQELIEKRNARMAHRVLQLLQQYPDESFFFAFGTGISPPHRFI
ncbi:hypothetical protein AVEN_180426-1 [Araneus ventricosus]|uniref:Metalloprotease TIKI homolog n=1 Tax=Araneus ventricosus TaxID=182803 RepID=A0A4Y2U7I2_ARAVE|nr:hypothetical protein AVEN_156717-1 [Araneus ventricosus]GBO08041.1 hypothetical protein AVEN_180426-1 [Araneus ventricosus]